MRDSDHRATRLVGRAWARPHGAAASLGVLVTLVLAFGCGARGEEEQQPAPGPEATLPQDRTVTPPSGPLPPRGTAWVVFGADTVHAEIANTADQRARGLMYRDNVPQGTGMLFVFEEPEVHSFWMQNTFVPLDIAFLDSELRIIDIQQMEPRSEDFHESRGPAMFALEVPQGWFAAHDIRVGDRAQVLFGGM